MLEYTNEVINGIDIVSSLYPDLKNIYLAIEDNKKDVKKSDGRCDLG